MLTRKSQYGWMVVGGILCLCGGVVALKLREGNQAVAQAEAPTPAPPTADVPPPPPAPAPDGDTKAAPAPESAPKSSREVVAPPLPTPGPMDPLPPPAPATPDAPPTPGPSSDPLLPPSPPPPPAAVQPAPPPAPQPPLPPDVKTDRGPEPTPPTATLPPTWNEPTAPAAKAGPPAPPVKMMPPAVEQVSQVGEPPLAGAGPIQVYQVRNAGETMRDIARRTLGAGERCVEVYKLNPALHPEDALDAGTVVHLPPDACLPVEEVEGLKPLPAMRPKTTAAKPKTVLALTGTYPCNLDDKRTLTLPRAVRDQFGDADLVLASPGPDQCLWLTDQAHQERLAERLEHSPAREVDVRVFKRLYYAQTEKVPVGADGRITLSDRLAQFAGLSQEVVLVGIDDHFEVWDAARWKQYTQAKSAAAAGSD